MREDLRLRATGNEAEQYRQYERSAHCFGIMPWNLLSPDWSHIGNLNPHGRLIERAQNTMPNFTLL
jgi:hypothetical protein